MTTSKNTAAAKNPKNCIPVPKARLIIVAINPTNVRAPGFLFFLLLITLYFSREKIGEKQKKVV
jgi:hypothetical protein